MSSNGYSHGFLRGGAELTSEVGRRAAEVMVDVLRDAGVEVVFGLPGGAIAPIHDALLDHPDIRVITTRHESGAMFAAQAYARATGKIGVVLVTSGPGILNAMTGLAAAHCDGMPVLLLAGEVPRQVFGRQALQEGSAHHLDVLAGCRAISKMAAQIPTADVAPAMLQRAIATALSGRRGPVVLTLPLDLMSSTIRPPRVTCDVGVSLGVGSPAMTAGITAAAEILAGAKRPLIFAGSGTRWGEGPRRLRELAEKIGVPVMTTPKAKGVFPESHPLSLGVFGYGGHPSTSAYLEGEAVDALLAVGTGLGDVATNGWSRLLSQPRHFLQIDVDALQIGRNYPVTHGLVGDAAEILGALARSSPDTPRPQHAEARLCRFSDPALIAHGPEGLITPMRAIWELQQSMPQQTLYTCDIGEHLLFAIHYLSTDDPQAFAVMTGLGSMGSSVAGAIGLRLAMPDRPVVAICGDGCFSMNLGDVAVAAREGIPLVVAVLNDERYGMVEIGHENVYGRRPAYPAGPMDVVLMAKSVGAETLRVEHGDEILTSDLAERAKGGPVVLDIRIDRNIRMPKNGRNESMRTVVAPRVLH